MDKRAFIFLFNVFFFLLDSIFNFNLDIPVYAASLILLFLAFLIPGFFSLEKYSIYKIICFLFSVSFVVSLFTVGFNKDSLSDYLFIMSFFGATFLYSSKQDLIKHHHLYINIFFGVCLILFLPTFFGFDKNSWGDTISVASDDIEYNRSYRQGIFRIAHVAGYFFSYLLLYYSNTVWKSKDFSLKNILVLLGITTIILLTGSRTPIAIIILSLLLFFFRLKYIKVLIPFLAFLIVMLLNVEVLLLYSKNTVVYQYVSLLKTMTVNFPRLSRVIIWKSWWSEIQSFGFVDFLFGRGLHASKLANLKNIGSSIWFHNDFLSIVYSYGVFPLIAYTLLFFKIYTTHKVYIKDNIFIFCAFSGLWLSAFLNGFYYYYPLITLYLFFAMVQSEHKEVFND